MTGRKEAFRSVQLTQATGNLNAVSQMKEQRRCRKQRLDGSPQSSSAGWLAEMFMKSGTGVFMNIVLGIVGAAVANWLLGLLGVALSGWLGYLITGFVGACIIIAIWRAIRSRQAV
jgi:uncharacterized membrane protein YeaQ/YmgE (transglycosylase-associated protein family)